MWANAASGDYSGPDEHYFVHRCVGGVTVGGTEIGEVPLRSSLVVIAKTSSGATHLIVFSGGEVFLRSKPITSFSDTRPTDFDEIMGLTS